MWAREKGEEKGNVSRSIEWKKKPAAFLMQLKGKRKQPTRSPVDRSRQSARPQGEKGEKRGSLTSSGPAGKPASVVLCEKRKRDRV